MSNFNKLLAPLLYYEKADCVQRNHLEKALKTIHQYKSFEICYLFLSQQELEKTFRYCPSLYQFFLYEEALIFVNVFVVKQ